MMTMMTMTIMIIMVMINLIIVLPPRVLVEASHDSAAYAAHLLVQRRLEQELARVNGGGGVAGIDADFAGAAAVHNLRTLRMWAAATE
jgi:hypothetical protein